ncbi:MAG TPA: phasin family protein [Xanthomonadales bacterium]|nr:phasin family protein [Xanthomonadales bacterium]
MAKKMLKKKVQRKPAAKDLAAPVVDSAREVWLAGLGAFSVAQQESGRIFEQGSKLFDRLVAEGSKIEKKTRSGVEGAVDELRSEVESRVEGMKQQADAVRKQASDNWDKLEKIFEDRVARALARMGIPGKDEVNDLADKVQKLTRQVAELDKASAAKKAPPRKPVAKKATPKKTSSK